MKTKVFSVMKRKSNYIKIIILFLTLFAIYFILDCSLVVQTNETEQTKLVINENFLQNLNFTQILIGISTALAAILAIVFAFSQVILSNISDKYTPYILGKYKEDKMTYLTFLIFITTIVIAIFSSIFVVDISSVWKLGILLLIATMFGSCFFSLASYFDYMFDIINPLKFIEKLKEDINQNVEEINEGETKDYITALGDIAIKSLRRGDDNVVKKILNIKFEIFKNFLKLKAQDPKRYKMEKRSFSHQPKEEKNRISKYLLEQQFRLFKNAIQIKNDDITIEVASKLSDYIFELIQVSENKDIFSEVMDTSSFHRNLFSQFLEEAIKANDGSKYRLMWTFPRVLLHPLPLKKFREEYMENFTYTNILRSNEMIINNDDFELFKDEIHTFSLGLHLDPLSSKQKIENNLPLLDVPFYYFNSKEETESFRKRCKELIFYIQFVLIKNFFLNDTYKEFKKLIREFFDHTEKSCDAIDIDHQRKTQSERFENWKGNNFEKLKDDVKNQVSKFKKSKKEIMNEIKNELDNFYISSILYKTFFDVGWYILFCKEHKNIDAQKYLKELWTHTTPEDSITTTLNQPPISFDIKFITLMFLYGGIGDTSWKSFTELKDFHDAIHYIYYYYLLLLTYSRMEFNRDLDISIGSKDTNFELEEEYRFLNDFIYEGEKREENKVGGLIEHIDELIAKADEWNELIHFRLENKEINAETAFKETKEWIKEKVEKFKEAKVELEKKLPIDEKKVKKCKKEILKSYNETSEIAGIVDQEEYDRRNGKLELIEIAIRSKKCAKDCFIKVSNVSCDWRNLGEFISSGEINYILKSISKHKKIKKDKIKLKDQKDIEKLFSKVFKIIECLKNKNYNPSFIFIPIRYFTLIFNKNNERNSILYNKLEIEDGKRYLVPDKNTKLKIFFSSKNIPFEDIIILDKSAGIWTYKIDERTGERLFVDIKEYEKDKTKVDVYVRTLVNFRITNPEKIRILEIGSSSDYPSKS